MLDRVTNIRNNILVDHHVAVGYELPPVREIGKEKDLKPTIHEATFIAGNTATLLFVHVVHEISNATFYKLFENSSPSISKRLVECSTLTLCANVHASYRVYGYFCPLIWF